MWCREKYKYTPCYCEENVWHLCNEGIGSNGKAVFISNNNMQCPMWHQRAASVGEAVIWDYHVVYLGWIKKQWLIFDLDTTLQFPTSSEVYLSASFPRRITNPYKPVFRVVEASELISNFSSNREHMISKGGEYKNQPPEWPLICKDNENNLSRFIDFEDEFIGDILTLAQFKERFTRPVSKNKKGTHYNET